MFVKNIFVLKLKNDLFRILLISIFVEIGIMKIGVVEVGVVEIVVVKISIANLLSLASQQ